MGEFVVGPDGRVLSQDEIDQARRLDDPVSIEGAPDTSRVLEARVVIERTLRSIRLLEDRIRQDEHELPHESDGELRDHLATSINVNKRRIAELRAQVAANQAIVAGGSTTP